MEMRITRARKIVADGKHNAFTGIAAAYDKTFIAFRSGASHVSGDGTVKLIASPDMETWQVATELRHPGVDLRDPKVVLFGKKLMLYCGEHRGDGSFQSLVAQSSNGVTFGEAVPLRGIPKNRWLWHVQPLGDTLYGAAYSTRAGECPASLYASRDGAAWKPVADFPGAGNEVYLDFDRDGVLWALVRDAYPWCIPALCVAEPPYSRFRLVMGLPMRLQGPMLKRLDGGCAIICRQWDQPGRRNLRTDLFWLEDSRAIRRMLTLPSGGDTSYAGWLDLKKGQAAVSYYSSHEHKMDEPHANDAVFAKDDAYAEHSTAADIFLADVSYACHA